jgi:hypothetical protein
MTRTLERLVVVTIVVALAAAGGTALAKPPPCPGGRYLVYAGSLVPGVVRSGPDVVTLAGRTLAVASGCASTKARVRATRGGTKVLARWTRCDGLDAKVQLRGTITEYCRSLTGTFTSRRAGVTVPFIAALSACGDGVWDAEGGEACDGDLGPCGALCTTCQCPGGVTTTTNSPSSTTVTTTTAPGSSTTIPGGVTTTTTVGGGSSTSTVVTTTAPPTSSTSVSTTTTMPTLPTTSTTSTTMPGPDLQPTGFSGPGSAPSGATVLIGYSAKNVGTLTANASWWDYVLVSTDATFGGDTAFGLYQRTANLAPGAEYSVSQNMTLPALPPGSYYIFLQLDGASLLTESQENNNLVGPVALTITP